MGPTLIFACSVRPNRDNNRVLKLVENRLRLRGHEVHVIDPLNVQLPLLTTPYHFYGDPENEAPATLKDLVHTVSGASQLIFTTGECNVAMPSALKNLIDYLPHFALAYKPAGIISYSKRHDQGVHAVSNLRMTLSELGCVTAPHFMVLYNVDQRLSPDGEPIGTSSRCQGLLNEVDLVLEQVEWIGKALENFKNDTNNVLPKVHPYL